MDEKKYGFNYLGHVIRILSNTELIVNVGDDQLTVGDDVYIYVVGDEIKDLDGISLGVFEHNKAKLHVISTTPYYSVCQSNKIVHNSQWTSLINSMPKVVTNEKLNVLEEEIKKIEIKDRDIIRIGDLVKKA